MSCSAFCTTQVSVMVPPDGTVVALATKLFIVGKGTSAELLCSDFEQPCVPTSAASASKNTSRFRFSMSPLDPKTLVCIPAGDCGLITVHQRDQSLEACSKIGIGRDRPLCYGAACWPRVPGFQPGEETNVRQQSKSAEYCSACSIGGRCVRRMGGECGLSAEPIQRIHFGAVSGLDGLREADLAPVDRVLHRPDQRSGPTERRSRPGRELNHRAQPGCFGDGGYRRRGTRPRQRQGAIA